MKIAFHTLNLQLQKNIGGNIYAKNLIRSLIKSGPEDEFLVFLDNLSTADELELPKESANFKLIPVNVWRNGGVLERGWRKLLRQLRLSPDFAEGMRSGRWKADVLHHPDAITEDISFKPTVVSILDLMFFYYPDFFPKDVLEKRKRQIDKAIQSASQIIAISEFTRETILENYHVSTDQITVTPLAADDQFKPLNRELAKAQLREFNLPADFALYPAGLWPHKNHLNLIEAWALLKVQYGIACPLVLTGYGMPGEAEEYKKVRDIVYLKKIEKEVIFLGEVPRIKMPMLYNAAMLVVFPSLFEGFGLSVIEAAACGCPVVCSNVPALREVMGDAAQFFNPLDSLEMADIIYKTLTEKDMRKQLSEKGLARSQNFSWKRTAELTLRTYKQAIMR